MKPATPVDLEQQIRHAMAAGDWFEAERLGSHLDRQPQPEPQLLPAALWYAAQGLRVFPLQPGLKVPMPGSRGCHDATSDPAQLTAWWTRWPTANLAIATGHLVDVIDIDGPVGVLSWARCDDLPTSIGVVSTPRPGGTHLYIPATGQGNRAGILPGVDYRGLGGYVLAPPSTLPPAPDRSYHGAYSWRRPPMLQSLGVVA